MMQRIENAKLPCPRRIQDSQHIRNTLVNEFAMSSTAIRRNHTDPRCSRIDQIRFSALVTMARTAAKFLPKKSAGFPLTGLNT
jgi:hypothetical protein